MNIKIESSNVDIKQELSRLFQDVMKLNIDDIHDEMISGRECIFIMEVDHSQGILSAKRILTDPIEVIDDPHDKKYVLHVDDIYVNFKSYEVAHFKQDPFLKTRDYRQNLIGLSTQSDTIKEQELSRFHLVSDRIKRFILVELDRIALIHLFPRFGMNATSFDLSLSNNDDYGVEESTGYFDSRSVNTNGDVVFNDGFRLNLSSFSNKETLCKLRDYLRENCMNNIFSITTPANDLNSIICDSISQTHVAIYFSYVIEKLLESLE